MEAPALYRKTAGLRFFVTWMVVNFFVGWVTTFLWVKGLQGTAPNAPPQFAREFAFGMLQSLVSGLAQTWALRREFVRPWDWLMWTMVGGVFSSLVGLARIQGAVAMPLSSGAVAFCQALFFVARLGPAGWTWFPAKTVVVTGSWWILVAMIQARQSAFLNFTVGLGLNAIGQAGILFWMMRARPSSVRVNASPS